MFASALSHAPNWKQLSCLYCACTIDWWQLPFRVYGGFMPNYFYCRAGNLRKSCEQILDNLKFRNNRVVRGIKKRLGICLKPENNVSEVDSSFHLEYFKCLRRSVDADFYFYFICNYYKYSNQYYTFPWHFLIISWYFLLLSWK